MGLRKNELKQLEIMEYVEQCDLDVVRIQETWVQKIGKLILRWRGAARYDWRGRVETTSRRGREEWDFFIEIRIFLYFPTCDEDLVRVEHLAADPERRGAKRVYS